MIASWIRWLRVVLPPTWTLIFVAVAYLVFESFYVFVRFWLQIPASDCAEILKIRDIPMVMAVVLFGLYRVFAFHPVFNNNYYSWLRRTPWTTKKPLLNGPLSVTLQDIVVIGILRGLLHGYQLHEAAMPLAFLMAYSLATAVSCWMTSPRTLSYVITFAIGVVALAANVSFWLSLAMAAIVHVVGWYGIRHSLTLFPWSHEMAQFKSLKLQLNSSRSTLDPELSTAELEADCLPILFGWPTNVLHPRRNTRMLSRHDYVWLSILAGWMAFIFLTSPHPNEDVALMSQLLFNFFGCGCVIARLFAYCLNYWPPISFVGRIWTGRLIIPGYDRVFISPACTAAISIVGGSLIYVTRTNQLWLAAIAGASISGTLLSALLIGPSLEHWRLTGQHRIVPGLRRPRDFNEI